MHDGHWPRGAYPDAHQLPHHVGDVAVCRFCGVLTPITHQARCIGCDGAIELLEPLAVECGWCDASNRRDLTDKCVRCGGPLPALPGGNPGPTPPPAPRMLPADYPGRIRYWKNVEVLIGIVFTIVFCWSVVFPIIGIVLWTRGSRRAEQKLRALRYGHLTRGRITSIEVDMSQHINHQHPWTIAFEFDTPHGPGHGACTAWDPFNARRSRGDVLWVAYTSMGENEAAIWPPIR